MTYVLSSAKLNATGLRWVGELSDFNFSIKYRPGKCHIDADSFSRMPFDINKYMPECTESIPEETVKTMYQSAQGISVGKSPWITAIVNSASVLKEELSKHNAENVSTKKEIDLLKAQHEDHNIHRIIELKSTDKKLTPNEKKMESAEVRQYLHEMSRLFLRKDGLLCRKIEAHEQAVLPKSLRRLIYKELHENMGHLGPEKVYQLSKDRFYWPFMKNDIEHFIHNCCRCVKQIPKHLPIREPLQPITSSSPFDLISVDFVHLEQSSGGYEYILVIVDHFTKFAQAYPTKNKSGTTVAMKIFSELIPRFGFPGRIIHDQGGEFENALFKKLTELSGVQNLRTTPYHPQGNGIVERMNRTLLGMLRTLPENHKSKWASHVNHLIHAYNCTRHDTTGYSPYYLLFGRHPRLPLDLLLNLKQPSSTTSYPKYVAEWKNAMEEAYRIASKAAQTRAAQGKQQYDKKVHSSVLEPGDRVLVKNLTPRGGPGELRSYWEQQVYKVISRMGADSPVYKVEPDGKKGKARILHRNLLLPCNDLPIADDQADQKKMKPTTASGKRSIPLKHDQSESEEEEDCSFEPDGLEFLQPSTIHGHSPSSTPTGKKEMVNVSYPELPQPVQAHEKDSVTSPNLAESVPESPPQVYETPTSSPRVHETPTLPRPQRARKPPSRFMYYSAGEPFSCSNVFTNFPPSAVIPPKPPWFWVPTPHPSFPMMLPQPPPMLFYHYQTPPLSPTVFGTVTPVQMPYLSTTGSMPVFQQEHLSY